MPKVLVGVRSLIMEVARRQLVDGGYEALTLRSVASECNVSIGTIYNHFESKDALISALMIDEWVAALTNVSADIIEAVSPRDAMERLYSALVAYSHKYLRVIQEFPPACCAQLSMRRNHDTLREQLMRLIKPIIERFSRMKQPSLCEFLADAIIVESQRDFPFTDFYDIISVYFSEP